MLCSNLSANVSHTTPCVYSGSWLTSLQTGVLKTQGMARPPNTPACSGYLSQDRRNLHAEGDRQDVHLMQVMFMPKTLIRVN